MERPAEPFCGRLVFVGPRRETLLTVFVETATLPLRNRLNFFCFPYDTIVRAKTFVTMNRKVITVEMRMVLIPVQCAVVVVVGVHAEWQILQTTICESSAATFNH